MYLHLIIKSNSKLQVSIYNTEYSTWICPVATQRLKDVRVIAREQWILKIQKKCNGAHQSHVWLHRVGQLHTANLLNRWDFTVQSLFYSLKLCWWAFPLGRFLLICLQKNTVCSSWCFWWEKDPVSSVIFYYLRNVL